MSKEEPNELQTFVESYETYLTAAFDDIWGAVKIDPQELDAYSVIGGLLSRQVTLSIQLARSPGTWNGHSAPLFLRAMTDLHITLAWIMLDISERSKKYILHGLGEEKLLMEQYKQEISSNPENPLNAQMQSIVDIKKNWINTQRQEFFVEVNLGNWSQLDYRKMATESDSESLYKFAYKPFSQAAHNMWPHISVYNSRVCENPLHKYHLIPELFHVPMDVDYMYRSCKYVDKAFRLLQEKFTLELKFPLPLQWWDEFFSNNVDHGV